MSTQQERDQPLSFSARWEIGLALEQLCGESTACEELVSGSMRKEWSRLGATAVTLRAVLASAHRTVTNALKETKKPSMTGQALQWFAGALERLDCCDC